MAEEYNSKWTGEQIDEGIENALESINDKTPTFTEAIERANITSGEKISVIFGKLMKWFTDLSKVAFSGSYEDLSSKPTIPTIPPALPNPEKLTFTGGSAADYDGSAAVKVAIPETLPAAGGTSDAVYDRTHPTTPIYFNYGAAGLTTTSWLAAWNQYELRAIAPSAVLSTINGQAKHTTVTVTLAAASWSASNTISVAANGVTASNTVIVSPTPASFAAYSEANIRCTAQGTNSLTFTADNKPTVEITVNVVILN